MPNAESLVKAVISSGMLAWRLESCGWGSGEIQAMLPCSFVGVSR
jgi:hypothetical protein